MKFIQQITYDLGSLEYYRDELGWDVDSIEDVVEIIKDWNGNIWLVMFTSDIELTFRNEWGMGIANFNATWTEIGSAEDQYDLQNSGLIDIGGV